MSTPPKWNPNRARDRSLRVCLARLWDTEPVKVNDDKKPAVHGMHSLTVVAMPDRELTRTGAPCISSSTVIVQPDVGPTVLLIVNPGDLDHTIRRRSNRQLRSIGLFWGEADGLARGGQLSAL